jgi:hypothetical protein
MQETDLPRRSDESPGRSEHESLSDAGAIAEANRQEKREVELVLPSAEDYSCPICLELLLRPVALSCGHHLCRGCWIRVIQGSHANLALTGTPRPWNYRIPCPLGRCQVRPIVRLDVALMSELESRFGPLLAARTAEHTLPEEERMAKEVNVWAAAGCRREMPSNHVTSTARAERAESEEARSVTMPLLVAWGCGFSCIVMLISDSLRFEPPLGPHRHTACL